MSTFDLDELNKKAEEFKIKQTEQNDQFMQKTRNTIDQQIKSIEENCKQSLKNHYIKHGKFPSVIGYLSDCSTKLYIHLPQSVNELQKINSEISGYYKNGVYIRSKIYHNSLLEQDRLCIDIAMDHEHFT